MWVWLLANKLVQFVLLTDSFIIVICKTSKISTLNVNNNSFLGPLVKVALWRKFLTASIYVKATVYFSATVIFSLF